MPHLRRYHDPERELLQVHELRQHQRLQLEGSFVGDDWHQDA